MNEEQETKRAIAFADSTRGQYIVSQALTLSVKILKEREEANLITAEPSNRADMEYLRDNVFPLYYITEQAREQFLGTASDENRDLVRSMLANLLPEEVEQVVDALAEKRKEQDD